MRDALLKLIIALEDKASAGLRGIQSALGAVAGGASGAAAGFASFLSGAAQFAVGGLIQKGIEGIAASVGALKDGMIGGNAEFERYGVQFGVLLGNADAAKQRLADLAQFGASTPFELPEVVRADKIIQSFGLHAQDAAKKFGYAGTDIRRIAGDTAAGTGASFEEISTYIGKFASGATGETIARFQELGIVTKQQLTEMGLAFDKGGSLIINSQEDLDRATGILLKSMEGKFGGMMAAQSQTFEGMLSNLADWKAGTLRIIGEPIFEVLRTHLSDLLAWLPSQQPRIEAFAQALANGLAVGIPRAIELGRVLVDLGRYVRSVVDHGDYLNDWLTHLPAGMQGAVEMAGRVTVGLMDLAARGVEAVRPGFEWLTGTGLPAVQAGWGWLTGTGLPAAQQGFDAVAGVLNGAFQTGMAWLTGTGLPALQAGWEAAQGPIAAGREALAGLQPILDPLLGALQPIIDGFGEGGLAGALSAIPGAIPGILTELSDLRTELTALALEGIGGLLTKAAEMPQLAEGLASLGLSQPAIDAVTGTLRTMGEMLETVGGWVRNVGQWLMDDLLPPVIEAGAGFAEMLMPHLARLGEIVQTTVLPILEDFGRFIGANLPGLISVLAPLLTGLIDNGLSILELALRAIGVTWETYLKPAFEAIGGWLEDLTGGWDNLARGAERLQGTLAAVAQAISDIASGNVDFSQIFGGLQNLFSGNINIPGFANGVTNFSGGLAMVGERGPELVRLPGGSDVIPSGGFGGGGGGGQIINVSVAVGGSVTAERDLAETIRRELIEIGRNNIGAGIP